MYIIKECQKKKQIIANLGTGEARIKFKWIERLFHRSNKNKNKNT